MTVWIVVQYLEAQPDFIHGVFSSEEKAVAYILKVEDRESNTDAHNGFGHWEFELDQVEGN